MIKGLCITPPVIGRIGIGKVVERNGKRLPEKDDSFTVTTLVQNKEGWVNHPLHVSLVTDNKGGKLRSIPVKMLFNAPDLNFRAQYSLFDRTTGRPACVGNGVTGKRVTDKGIEELHCAGPDACEYGSKHGCKPFGRLNVQIDGQGDELGAFIFRTTGFNSIRTLAARLSYFSAVSGGNLSTMPLQLKLRAKSTTQSHRTPIYFVDLVLRDGVSMQEAVKQAREEADTRKQSGIDVTSLEAAALAGFANGTFEESVEEVPELVEEFFGDGQDNDTGRVNAGAGAVSIALADKLVAKVRAGKMP